MLDRPFAPFIIKLDILNLKHYYFFFSNCNIPLSINIWSADFLHILFSLLLYHPLMSIGQLFTLWSWLPARITMYTPTLLYTTEEHGCSLTTFYVRVEQHEPTLLMIKTCNNEVSARAIFFIYFSFSLLFNFYLKLSFNF